jgi:hypothetical protein
MLLEPGSGVIRMKTMIAVDTKHHEAFHNLI